MAELVGVAASATGIAGAAVQLTECVVKLQKLVREIKNAPPRLRCLLEEIEIAGDLLAQFASHRTQEQITVDPRPLNRSISLCHRAVDDLAAVVADLQASMRRSKLRCAIDLVLHKTELQELIQRVQGSLGLLHLAHSAFAYSSNQQQLAFQRELLEEIKDCQMKTPKPGEVSGETQKRVTSSLVISHPKIKYLARTPTWLLRQSWEISVSFAISCGTFSLRSYRISPAIENPAFDCCRSGDLDGLTRLLKERRASIYDEDEDGSSLFMFAVVGCSFDMAHLLVQAGVDPQKAGNDELHSVAAFWEYTRWQILTLEDVTNHLQFLMDDCDTNADDCWYGTALRLLANGLSEKTTPHERLLVFDTQLSAQWSVSKNLAPLVAVFEPALHDPKFRAQF